MKLEMSYRDKMILLVLGIVAILLLGFFFLIKPQYDSLQATKVLYEHTKEKADAIDVKINAIPTLKDTITKKYDEASKTAEVFINTAFVTANETFSHEKTYYELDQYIQAAVDESEWEVTGFELAPAGYKTVEYYYYTPDVLSYSLLEAADINDNYATQITETMLESLVLEKREVVDVLSAELGIVGDITKEGMMTFLGKIDTDKNAVIVKEMDIEDYDFIDGTEEEIVDELGNTTVRIDPNAVGTSEVTIILSFYNAKEIDKPELGD